MVISCPRARQNGAHTTRWLKELAGLDVGEHRQPLVAKSIGQSLKRQPRRNHFFGSVGGILRNQKYPGFL